MNSLDIKFHIDLKKAKQKINNIDSINRLAFTILQEASTDGAERFRFWYKKLRKIHPLVDHYLSGHFISEPISDVMGEHFLNLSPDTQTVDLKYYYENVKDDTGQTKSNGLLPLPIRSSIRSKIPVDQLKMTEDSYIELNKSFSIIMSTFFNSKDSNNWVITRNIGHGFYSTPDYIGFGVKLLLYDLQFQTLSAKLEKKLQLLDTVTPVQESVLIEYENFIINVEGKELLSDSLGNKVVKKPSIADKSILDPTPLT